LNKRSFAYYNVELKDWHVETGDFHILIGKSSRDIVLSERIHVESSVHVPLQVHRNTTVGDLLSDPVLAPVAKDMLSKFGQNSLMDTREMDAETAEMMAAMMKYIPLRAIANFSQGAFTDEMLDGLIKQLNAHTTTS
jgi:beta-glucosidase